MTHLNDDQNLEFVQKANAANSFSDNFFSRAIASDPKGAAEYDDEDDEEDDGYDDKNTIPKNDKNNSDSEISKEDDGLNIDRRNVEEDANTSTGEDNRRGQVVE